MAVDEAQLWKAEFAEYLSQNQTRLYGYIHSLVRDLNDADDLFQQTTLILWRKFGEFDRRLSFSPGRAAWPGWRRPTSSAAGAGNGCTSATS